MTFKQLYIEGQRWARSDWQPIETAPKDGSWVLVWRPDEGDKQHEAHVGIDTWWGNCWYRSRRNQQPTHWMPLPSAPDPG